MKEGNCPHDSENKMHITMRCINLKKICYFLKSSLRLVRSPFIIHFFNCLPAKQEDDGMLPSGAGDEPSATENGTIRSRPNRPKQRQ